jgi:ribonuclease H-related protein
MALKEIHIYIDGSYHPTGGTGYGFVVLNADEEITYTEAEPIYEAGYQNNTSAELIAAMRALKWAERHGYRIIHLHHDYVGVHSAAFETPYVTNLLHCLYHHFFSHRLCSKKTKIHFHKVAAHSGNVFNELADKLAKYGRGRNLRKAWGNLSRRYGQLHPALSIFQHSDRTRNDYSNGLKLA